MSNSANELNKILGRTIVYDLLSEMGKRFYFPKKIVFQCAEATGKARLYNASAGIALDRKIPFETDSIKKRIQSITPEEAVSYAPTSGDPVLTALWKQQLLNKNPSLKDLSFSEPLVVSGITNAISVIADLFIEKGDRIFLPDLYWDNYKLVFETKNQGEIINYPLFDKSGNFNISAMTESITNNSTGSKIIILFNFPNNPTGFAPSAESVLLIKDSLVKIAESGKKILVIIDDAYFGMFYDNTVYRESLFSIFADSHKNILAVKADGASKEHYYWGMRIGFITYGLKNMSGKSYAALIDKTKGVIRSTISSSCRLSQTLLVKALTDPDYDSQILFFYNVLKDRYLKVKEITGKNVSRKLKPLPFNSGYFMTFSTSFDSEILRKKLLNEYGIGTVSLQNRYLRVAYSAVEIENLEKLFEIIYSTAEQC